jgi:cell wall-associated NlpC family hydrolase
MSVDVPRLVDALHAMRGTPFAHQGRGAAGLDCVGLLLRGLAEQGVEVDAPANYTPGAAGALLLSALNASPLLYPLADTGEPHAGEVMVFRIWRHAQHVAVAAGAGNMIHAILGPGVVVVTISALWRKRLVARYGWA